MTEAELIAGIKERQRPAFQILVDRYRDQVIKTAFYFLGDMADAEDLSQEIFIEIIQSIHDFRQTSTLKTWIYRITVNKALNMVKQRKRRGIFFQIGSLFHGDNPLNTQDFAEPVIQTDAVEKQETRTMIQKAIDKLPENQRIAFVLSRFDNQPYKEIAGIMNISLPAVESLIFRARQNLQKQLVRSFPEYKSNL